MQTSEAGVGVARQEDRVAQGGRTGALPGAGQPGAGDSCFLYTQTSLYVTKACAQMACQTRRACVCQATKLATKASCLWDSSKAKRPLFVHRKRLPSAHFAALVPFEISNRDDPPVI
eukprot:gene6721-3392_t